MNTRRQFLITAPLGVLVAAGACSNDTPPGTSQSTPAAPPTPPSTPGAPPTFGTGAGSGPAVSPATFAEAGKLMQVTMTEPERQQAADSWRRSMAPYLERRTGPRKVAIADTDAPATQRIRQTSSTNTTTMTSPNHGCTARIAPPPVGAPPPSPPPGSYAYDNRPIYRCSLSRKMA